MPIFADLPRLFGAPASFFSDGALVILTDVKGAHYTYTVFRSFVVGPSDYHVTFPVPGKNIVSLQTCTPIPTFEERLVVQAKLADVAPA